VDPAVGRDAVEDEVLMPCGDIGEIEGGVDVVTATVN